MFLSKPLMLIQKSRICHFYFMNDENFGFLMHVALKDKISSHLKLIAFCTSMIPFSMIDNVDTTLTPYARKERINFIRISKDYVIVT